MKRLLALSLTLALIFGLTVSASAFDLQRVETEHLSNIQERVISLGGLHPTKDYCKIYMLNAELGWVSGWTGFGSYLDSCAAYKKWIDPYDPRDTWEYYPCPEPQFPFNVESIDLLVYVAAGETVDFVFEFDLEEPVAGPGPLDSCAWIPGPQIFNTGPMAWSGVPGGFWKFVITFPSIWVYEPFFVSWEILAPQPHGNNWGFCTDTYVTDTVSVNYPTYCWNWFNACPFGDPTWYEWGPAGLSFPGFGNIYLLVDGRPYHNVAVDMGSFEAVPGDRRVTLNWQSLTETNNSHWILKRDGEQVARLDGQGSKETPTDYVWVDRSLTNGVEYSYMLEAVNYEGNVDEYGPVMATPFGVVPTKFALWQNYPNPFNASTVIRYQLPSDERVTLKVYNIYGQEVLTLVDADQKAGMHTVNWTGEGVSSGLYVYTLTAGGHSESKKMVFLK
jgi:hypothetical protein